MPNHDHRTWTHLERHLTEAFDDLWSSFVDPQDAIFDDGGNAWIPVVSELDARGAAASPLASEQQLRAIRAECRALAVTNEFAINGHENRISYIVGSGHTYRAAPLKGAL